MKASTTNHIIPIGLQVPNKAAARLVRSLVSIGQPGSLFPESSAIPVICPMTIPGNAEDPGRLECVWQQGVAPQFVQYHAKQFVSAVLVLVRYMLQQTSVGHQDIKPSLRQMHHDMQTVSRTDPVGSSRPAGDAACKHAVSCDFYACSRYRGTLLCHMSAAVETTSLR